MNAQERRIRSQTDGLVEVTDDNYDEHVTCTQQPDEDGRYWCIGWHCAHCGAATGMYGHSTDVPGVLSCMPSTDQPLREPGDDL